MKVVRPSFAPGDVISQELLKLRFSQGSTLEVGSAQFAAGVRSPPEGFHRRKAHEIAFILEGEFETESGGEKRTIRAGDLVSIPAGEPNASRALTPAKVIYAMYQSVDDAP